MKETDAPPEPPVVDFTNTATAFAHRSDRELRKAVRMFRLMNNPWIVKAASWLALWATRLRLPFAGLAIESTIFAIFCGGKTLSESLATIDKLSAVNTFSVLDYGVEAKSSEKDLDKTLDETIRAVKFAAGHPYVPVVSIKLTGIADNGVLIRWQQGRAFDGQEQQRFDRVGQRLDTLCSTAQALGMRIFIDAEESWMQNTIDHLVMQMMKQYNRQEVVVYNTYQLYLTGKLEQLMEDYAKARRQGFLLGAKLVRGAYMVKERQRAEEMGYPSPVHPDKTATDSAYNAAVRFCVDHYEHIASCNASHNLESNLLQAELIAQRDIPRAHPHLNFCQLLGMSDNITFNLAAAGFNVAKYVVYGPVREVVPFLIRRAEENSAVTADVSRELALVQQEIRRRKRVREVLG